VALGTVTADALYERDDAGRFLPTELTRGPWSPDHQHAGPPAAILARAIEEASTIAAGQTARLSFDILAPVPIAPLTVATRTLRAGRRIEQIEATLSGAEDDTRPLMRATAWRMRTNETPEVATPEPPPAPLADAERVGFEGWPGEDEVAYRDALEWHWMNGSFTEPGPACVWTRLSYPLVAGTDTSPLERLLVMVDAASGVSAVLPWDEYLFVNLDLAVNLERPPHGEWMAMDAQTRIGDVGAGQCTAVLSDGLGRVGTSAQTLMVETR
jgi:Thioesterase-like superfamily